jgi:hypothetical protein
VKDKKNIPVHHLNHRANFGLEMGHTSFDGARVELEGLAVHRDDCYSFLLIETGEGSMDVVFMFPYPFIIFITWCLAKYIITLKHMIVIPGTFL